MQNQSPLYIIYHSITLSHDFPMLNIHSNPQVEITNSPITFLHYNEFFEIGYCYEGNGLFFIDNKVLEYSSGDAVIIFPQQIHIAQSSSDLNSKWDFVNFNLIKLLNCVSVPNINSILNMHNPSKEFPNIFSPKQYPNIVWAVQQIIKEMRYQKDEYQSSVRSLIWYLFTCINRINQSDEPIKKISRDNMEIISPAINYMILHYPDDIAIPPLAQLCNISLSLLRRSFHSCIGMSPLEYLIQLRIKMAAVELKSSNKSITEIAEAVGFYSISSFNRHFLKHFGCSPREWIKRK